MCSRFLSVIVLALPVMAAELTPLRVCADPNNLPFSNERAEGFENRLAKVLAEQMRRSVEFVWWSERKSLVKNTLDEGRCDVLTGVPAGLDSAELTQPYYRSTYVFVSRKDRSLRVSSLNDSRLQQWRIGLHLVGDDYAPPGSALARRGITANVKGYSLFGAFGEPNPPARLIDAVASGEVDVAIVWGPFAGYFAPRERVALAITPVSPAADLSVPFVYDISMAVRKGNDGLGQQLGEALQRKCAEVQSILNEYGIPQVFGGGGNRRCADSQESRAASWR